MLSLCKILSKIIIKYYQIIVNGNVGNRIDNVDAKSPIDSIRGSIKSKSDTIDYERAKVESM